MSIASPLGERKCLEILMMVAQHCEHTKNHQMVHFKIIKVGILCHVNFILSPPTQKKRMRRVLYTSLHYITTFKLAFGIPL